MILYHIFDKTQEKYVFQTIFFIHLSPSVYAFAVKNPLLLIHTTVGIFILNRSFPARLYRQQIGKNAKKDLKIH